MIQIQFATARVYLHLLILFLTHAILLNSKFEYRLFVFFYHFNSSTTTGHTESFGRDVSAVSTTSFDLGK